MAGGTVSWYRKLVCFQVIPEVSLFSGDTGREHTEASCEHLHVFRYFRMSVLLLSPWLPRHDFRRWVTTTQTTFLTIHTLISLECIVLVKAGRGSDPTKVKRDFTIALSFMIAAIVAGMLCEIAYLVLKHTVFPPAEGNLRILRAPLLIGWRIRTPSWSFFKRKVFANRCLYHSECSSFNIKSSIHPKREITEHLSDHLD